MGLLENRDDEISTIAAQQPCQQVAKVEMFLSRLDQLTRAASLTQWVGRQNPTRKETTMIRRKPAAKPQPPPAAVTWQESTEGFWISVLESTQKPDSFLGEFTIAVVDLPRGAGARLMAFDDAISVTAVRQVINDAMDIFADTGTFRTGAEGLRRILRDAFIARGWEQAKR